MFIIEIILLFYKWLLIATFRISYFNSMKDIHLTFSFLHTEQSYFVRKLVV